MSAARLTRCGIMFMITISFDHNPATWPSCTTNANTKNINIKTRAAPHVHQPAASPAHAVCRYPLILLYLQGVSKKMVFCGKTAITTFKLIQNAKAGGVLENSGYLLPDGH